MSAFKYCRVEIAQRRKIQDKVNGDTRQRTDELGKALGDARDICVKSELVCFEAALVS